ncbi:Protein MOR1 [Camellia lanceoleosa]|uniref:Protein MOR1 n=1 Tax=Camellia lanceoleosa TaxID=1840588 RepID=A0ACC0GSF8_9ERIC|nr:Protein MOR1 [Camellia lanceoleosa]
MYPAFTLSICLLSLLFTQSQTLDHHSKPPPPKCLTPVVLLPISHREVGGESTKAEVGEPRSAANRPKPVAAWRRLHSIIANPLDFRPLASVCNMLAQKKIPDGQMEEMSQVGDPLEKAALKGIEWSYKSDEKAMPKNGMSAEEALQVYAHKRTTNNEGVPYITTALMDAKLGTEGRKDLFDWLSRQLSGLSNFPDAVHS